MAAEKREFHNISVTLFANRLKKAEDKLPHFIVKFKDTNPNAKYKWLNVGGAWENVSEKYGKSLSVKLDVDILKTLM